MRASPTFKDPELRKQRISEAMKGNKNARKCQPDCKCGKHSVYPHHSVGQVASEETRLRMSRSSKRNWQDPQYREKRAKSLLKARWKPTGPERRVHEWLDALGKKYVIHPVIKVELFGSGRRLRPDVYVPDEHLIIEVNGCYVHGCESCYGDRGLVHNRRKDELRLNAFQRAGYNTHVIWEHDLPELQFA